VEKVLATGALKRRIVDMGLTKGTTVTILRVAPLGDPIEITLRNYNLSIRKADAKNILVRMEK
jgi:ferrous iron transport protein A